MKIGEIKPANWSVVASIKAVDTVEDGVYTGESAESTAEQTEFYIANVESIGPNACDEDQCPELEEGETIWFSHFAGVHVPTEEGFTKVIRGHDIVAKTNDTDMKTENIKATENRILVELIAESEINEDGIATQLTQDPRQADTAKGSVLHCGPNADKYEAGTIVHFDPYCGSLIIREPNRNLKAVNSFDILFTT